MAHASVANPTTARPNGRTGPRFVRAININVPSVTATNATTHGHMRLRNVMTRIFTVLSPNLSEVVSSALSC